MVQSRHPLYFKLYVLGLERISRHTTNYSQEGLVPFVVDAVYAMAHALQDMQKGKCPRSKKVCRRMLPLAGQTLLYYIRNVSFIGQLTSASFL